jgi:thioredoxin-related protein
MKTLQSLALCVICLLGTLAFKADKNIDLQTKAKSEHKNIVIYFAGSDWCVPCHQFRESFLKSAKVDSVLSKSYVYYLADFPQRTKLEKKVEELNEHLADKLNPEGVFPKLVIADENLNIISVVHKSTDYSTAYQQLLANQK